jgi:hypothetical protein
MATQQFVKNEEGERLNVMSLWADRKSVVCFARHFGCRFCRQQVTGLNSIYDALKNEDVCH